ncbi:RidA family protein [Halomonas sp. ML-15]|uniref:RidA family protein n=1 Tax=Halomonas sp. ML-15 TaxID=2773305 RepID=UPI0017460945|nr:RidA family protein [Halomonas sp. ML-15]MBD3897232.1 RidA family protein [Halomonas sp. ML-15]
MPEHHNDPTLPSPQFPGSHIVLDDRYAFVSGLTVADIHGTEGDLGDIKKETHRVMRELERMLKLVNVHMRDVVRVDVHLADLDEISDMDSIYAEYFEGPHYPARTCTESPRLCGGCRVEITLMARRPE